MAESIEKSLLELDFASLARRTFTPSPAAWEDQVLYFLYFLIFDAARAAVADGVPKQRAGILVDEQFGTAILRDAQREGLITCCPAEESGQEEFEFEYGADFARHIEAFDPTFCKVLVRYNPGGTRR